MKTYTVHTEEFGVVYFGRSEETALLVYNEYMGNDHPVTLHNGIDVLAEFYPVIKAWRDVSNDPITNHYN